MEGVGMYTAAPNQVGNLNKQKNKSLRFPALFGANQTIVKPTYLYTIRDTTTRTILWFGFKLGAVSTWWQIPNIGTVAEFITGWLPVYWILGQIACHVAATIISKHDIRKDTYLNNVHLTQKDGVF